MKRLPRSVDALRGLRAARWVRESTERQTERYGPDAQRAIGDEAIARYGLTDSGRVWQVAHSGRTIATTAQFAEMLAGAGTEWDVLVVSYASRFARDLRTAINARHDLHLAGAVILFCDEALVSSDEDRWEQYVELTKEAESYSRRLAKRVTEGYAAKFRTLGDQGGAAPIGFHRVGSDRRLAIDPDAIGLPVAVFQRYATGVVSYADVGAELGMEAGAVREILRNPVYNGWVRRYRRSIMEERKPAPWRDEPPVSDALWDRVQELRLRRTRSSGQHAADRPRPLLSGLLHCSCGFRIRSNGTQGSPPHPVVIHHGRCDAWGERLTWPTAPYEAAIAAQVTGMRIPDSDVAALVRMLAHPSPALPSVRHGVERRLRDLAIAHAESRIGDADYLARREAIRSEPVVETPAEGIDAAEVVRWIRELPDAWAEASHDWRRALLAAVYERIVIEGERFVDVIPTSHAVARGLPALLPSVIELVSREGNKTSRYISIPVRGGEAARLRLRAARTA